MAESPWNILSRPTALKKIKMVVYLVTGANRGIGLELVKQLAALPEAFVYATARSPLSGKPVEALGLQNVELIYLDLQLSLEEIVDAMKVIKDGVDVVIQNAGVTSDNTFVPTLEYDLSEFTRVYDVNVVGTVKVYKAVHPYLYKKDTGATKKFVVISSIAGSIGGMQIAFNGYGMSKAAVNYLVKQLALENSQSPESLVKESVALALAPGTVDTDMAQEAIAKAIPGINDVLHTVQENVSSMVGVIQRLSLKDSGNFYEYDGSVLPY